VGVDRDSTLRDNAGNLIMLTEWLQKAGEVVGLGDWRPRYGRFTVEAV
jgi:hypothetical protein